MTDNIETNPTPANQPEKNAPDSLPDAQQTISPIEMTPAAAAIPSKKGKNKALIAVIVVLVLLVLVAGGGFLGLRIYENNAAQQSQVSLKNQQWAQAETISNQALQLEQTGLMVDPVSFQMTRGEARYRQGKYDLALADLQTVQNLLPADARPYQYQAEIFFKQGKLKEAIGTAEELGKRNPQSGLPDALKAYDAYLQNKYTDALAGANSAIQRDPNLALAYRVRGGVQILQNNIDSSLADLNKALELEPDQPQALGLRAYAYSADHQDEKAKQDSERLKTIAPDIADALFAQAVIALNESKKDDANKLINQAISQSGNFPLFYGVRAATYNKTEDIQKQLDDLDQALKLFPDFTPAISVKDTILFTYYKKVDMEAEANRVLQLSPKSSLGHIMLVQKYIRDLDWKKAQDEAEKIITDKPNSIEGYLSRAEVYLDQHEYSKALADYQKVTELEPQSTFGYIGTTRLYFMQHKYDDALKVLSQAEKLDANSCSNYSVRAMILLAQKDKANAQKALDEAFKIDPVCLEGLAVRASLSLQDKDPMEAMSDVNKLGDIMPEHPVWMILRAQVYLANKDIDKAIAELDKADKINYKISDSFMVRSQVNFLKNDPEKAYDVLKRGIYLFPWDAGMHSALSGAYLLTLEDRSAINEGTKALELDDQLYPTYFTIGMAQWNMGNVEAAVDSFSKLKGHEKDLDVNQLDSLEKSIAFLKDVPKAVNGKRLYQNDEFNFKLNYATSWVPRQPTIQGSLYRLDDSEAHGTVFVDFIANKVDQPVPPGLGSAGQVADAMKSILSKEDSYEFISRKVITAGNTQGYADTFIIQVKDNKGGKLAMKFKQYYFVSSGTFVLIEYTAPAVLFSRFEPKADAMAETFSFTKP